MAVGAPLVAPKRRLRAKVRLDGEVSKFAAPGAIQSTSSSSPGTQSFRIKQEHAEYLIVEGVFDVEMLDRLAKFLARKRPRAAKMKNEGGDSDDERKARYNDRDSRVSWFNAQDECPWLHERLSAVTTWADQQQWKLLKVGADGRTKCDYEETQYAVYGANQHFKAWHQDAFAEGNDLEDARQITTVAMLSRRSDYTGGQFQAKVQGSAANKKLLKSLPLDAGDCVIFPAKRLVHRVNFVRSGIRKTLVYWASDKMSCNYYRDRLG